MLTKTEMKAVKTMQTAGFTFAGDNIFKSWTHGQRTLTRLVNLGYVTQTTGETEYRLTPAGYDAIKYA